MSNLVTVRPIHTDADLTGALARINEICDAKPGTPEGDELDVLVTLAVAYEREHYPVGPPNPIAAIRFALDQNALKDKDLIPFIGSQSRVSDVLSGRRGLTITMIRRLHEGLGIPLECLVAE
jgi:HTH-type transcriptional regulator / antitoxin HigA